MKRDATVITIFALVLLADYVCLRQTVAARGDLTAERFAAAVFAEVFFALLLAAGVALIGLRRNSPKTGRSATSSKAAVFRPIRRLFAAF